jgi:hypothetical protein
VRQTNEQRAIAEAKRILSGAEGQAKRDEAIRAIRYADGLHRALLATNAAARRSDAAAVAQRVLAGSRGAIDAGFGRVSRNVTASITALAARLDRAPKPAGVTPKPTPTVVNVRQPKPLVVPAPVITVKPPIIAAAPRPIVNITTPPIDVAAIRSGISAGFAAKSTVTPPAAVTPAPVQTTKPPQFDVASIKQALIDALATIDFTKVEQIDRSLNIGVLEIPVVRDPDKAGLEAVRELRAEQFRGAR